MLSCSNNLSDKSAITAADLATNLQHHQLYEINEQDNIFILSSKNNSFEHGTPALENNSAQNDEQILPVKLEAAERSYLSINDELADIYPDFNNEIEDYEDEDDKEANLEEDLQLLIENISSKLDAIKHEASIMDTKLSNYAQFIQNDHEFQSKEADVQLIEKYNTIIAPKALKLDVELSTIRQQIREEGWSSPLMKAREKYFLMHQKKQPKKNSASQENLTSANEQVTTPPDSPSQSNSNVLTMMTPNTRRKFFRIMTSPEIKHLFYEQKTKKPDNMDDEMKTQQDYTRDEIIHMALEESQHSQQRLSTIMEIAKQFNT